MGRFVSADSVVPGAPGLSIGPDKQSNGPANPQDLNRYAYVTNNPIKNTDLTGHCPWCIVGAAIGGIAGFAAYTYTHYDNFNWGHAAVWTGAGALAGGTLGFAGQAAAAAIATTEAATVIAEGTAATGAAVAQAASEEPAAEQATATGQMLLDAVSKVDARSALRAGIDGLSAGQTQKALDALGRGRVDSFSMRLLENGNVQMVADRAGQNGFQRLTYTLDPSGKTIALLQQAYNAAGEIVHIHDKVNDNIIK